MIAALLRRRFSFIYWLAAVHFLASEWVVSVVQLPPHWSQHFHDGKTYYYNQHTGATQWEPPVSDFQTEINEKDSNNNDFYANPANDRFAAEENFVNPVLSDPWATVDVDDDDDYLDTGATSAYNKESNGREEGPDDYSDNEDWHDDRFQKSAGSMIKASKVTRTLTSLKTGFSSLKAILKAKTAKRKGELLGAPRGSQQNYDNIDGPHRDDYEQFSDQRDPRRDEPRDPTQQQQHRNRNDPSTSLPSSQQQDSQNQRGSGPGSDPDWHQGPQQQRNLDRNLIPDPQGGPARERNGPLGTGTKQNDAKQSNKNLSGNRGEKDVVEKSPYDIEEDRLASMLKSQEYSSSVAPQKKISVRSMGKTDDNLWADYDDSDDKVDLKHVKNKNPFADLGLMSAESEGAGTRGGGAVYLVAGGLSSAMSACVGALSDIVPITSRMAAGVFSLAVRAAPLRLCVLLCVLMLQETLVPLGLVYVALTVRHGVRAMGPSSLLFSGVGGQGPIVIRPVSDPAGGDSFKSESSKGGKLEQVRTSVTDKVQSGGSDVFAGEGAETVFLMTRGGSPSDSFVSEGAGGGGEGVGVGVIEDSGSSGVSAAPIAPSIPTPPIGTETAPTNSDVGAEGLGASSHPFLTSRENKIKHINFADQDFGAASEASFERFRGVNFPEESSAGDDGMFEESTTQETNIFTDHIPIFSGVFVSLEKIFGGLVRELRGTFRKISEHSPTCALLGLVFISVILCGVLLPALKQSIGEKIVLHLQRKKAHDRRERSREEAERRSRAVESSYMSEEDDDEESGNAISSFMGAIRRRISPHRRAHTSPSPHTGHEGSPRCFGAGGAAAETLLSDFLEEGAREGSGPRGSLSARALKSPVTLLLCAVKSYLSPLYLVASLLFISLMAVEEQLKVSLSLPYLAALLFTYTEPYFNQPTHQDITRLSLRPQGPGHGPNNGNTSSKKGSSRFMQLNSILGKKKSNEELLKWNLVQSVEKMRSDELEKLRILRSSGRHEGEGVSGGGEVCVVDFNRTGGVYARMLRCILCTGLIAILSANAILAVMQASREKRIDLAHLFDNIAALDCPTILSDTIRSIKGIDGFESISVFLYGALSRFGSAAESVRDFLIAAGLSRTFLLDFAFPKPYKHDVLVSTTDILTADLAFQSQLLILLMGILLVPSLVWARTLRASSSALCAAGDLVCVGNSLDDPTFDSIFPRLQSVRSAARGAALPLYEDSGPSPSRDGGWTVDGPDKGSGVQLRGLSMSSGGRILFEDVSISFPPRTITVILAARSLSPSPSSCKRAHGEILEAIWGAGCSSTESSVGSMGGGAAPEGGTGSAGSGVCVRGGSVCVHGRELSEWSLRALRSRITYLKEGDLAFPLPAGLLSGCPPTPGPSPGRDSREGRIQEVTRLDELFSSLPHGRNTLVGDGEGLVGDCVALTGVQKKSLALSRALHFLDRDILLLEAPCEHLSEAQERTFFSLLRAEMKAQGGAGAVGDGKVVILTSSRFATAVHADRVVVMVDGCVAQEGSYKELIARPGPFRDQLFPPV